MKSAEKESAEFRSEEMDEGGNAEFLGLFGSIRHVVVTMLATLQSRLELFAVESKDLKVGAFSLAAWAIALVFLGFMALLFAIATLVFLFWEEALPVLIGLSIFFVVVAVGSFVAARNQLTKVPFGDSVDQLRKDRDLISEEFF